MSSGVFVIREDGSIEEMEQSEYQSEEILQELIAKHPNLIAGNLIDEKNPRKWLFIDREFGVPDKADARAQ